ncbi:MAG: hypothetical protein KDA96_21810 [Planctomycetaceae bacterium]|nr:hypothetical protein [Planctomycetaceae bacterium]
MKQLVASKRIVVLITCSVVIYSAFICAFRAGHIEAPADTAATHTRGDYSSQQPDGEQNDITPATERESLKTLVAIGADLKFNEQGHLISIDVSEKDISDKDLPSLAPFEHLESFFAIYTHINGDCLAGLSQTSTLTRLDLFASPVDDLHLSTMRQRGSLQYVNLGGTQLTDASLPILLSWPELQVLEIGDTRMSRSKLQTLKSQLPDCDVVF